MAAGFDQVIDMSAEGAHINGPGNQSLGALLADTLKALPKL